MIMYHPGALLLLLTATTNAAWVPVAYDMVDSTSLNLNAHTNPFAGAFSSSLDGFEKYTRGVSSSIPGPLLDDSLTNAADALGIVDSNDLDEFFGFADTENPQNAGPVLASWDFDITGETIAAIQLDAAAMGDFEQTGSTPDWFNWYARIDGGPQQLIFKGVADASLTLAYTMADASVVELVDPMTINGKGLTNKFEPFVAAYIGQGSTLTLELEAYAAGCCEASAFRNIQILADDGGPPDPPAETCPEEHCGNDVATTMAPTSTNCNLQAVTLASTVYTNGDVHVELLGPANPADAAAIVLTSPHGGYLEPSYIPVRTTNDPTYCPSSDCVVIRDSYTKEMTLSIQQHIIDNYCKVPYVIINNLHRNRLDANREEPEAAFGNPIAQTAWLDFHNYISDAQELVKTEFGASGGSSLPAGIVGLMLDVHGYVGSDWVPGGGGAPYIQWGHRINKNVLGQCPLDIFSGIYPIDDTYSQSSDLPNQSLECLVRGPKALGSRVTPPTGGVDNVCGFGLPSFDFPNVEELANDCTYCNNVCVDPADSCHFYQGGFDIRAHEYVDWQNAAGDLFNTVQAEFPRCIRFNTTMRDLVANDLSTAMCSFLHDLYGAAAETCGPPAVVSPSPVTIAPVTDAPVVPPTSSPVTPAPVVPPTSSPVTAAPVVPPTPSPVTPTLVCTNDSIVLDQPLDVEIRENSDRGGTRGTIVVDKVTSLGEARALIKFPNINTLPSGAVVTSAQLRFYTRNPTSGTITGYLMSNAWDNNSNWAGVSGGVDLSSTPPASFSFTPSVDEQDVMLTLIPAEIQDWVDGVTVNEGWIMVSNSSNNWVFRSVNGKASQRPYLTINYMACV